MNKDRSKSIIDNKRLNSELIKETNIHTNIGQEVIVTTEDKIRLCLHKYLKNMGKKSAWKVPLGIFISISLTLSTVTSFRDFVLSSETWTAIFVIMGVSSFVWLLISLRGIFTSTDIDSVIDELKKGSPVKENKTERSIILKDGRLVEIKTISH